MPTGGIRGFAIGVVACAFFASGCNAFDPCPNTKTREDLGQLDGTWDLTLVRYTSPFTGKEVTTRLPASPLSSAGPSLNEAHLVFLTRESNGDAKCTKLTKTSGPVMATFKFQKSAFSTEKSDWYGGRFERDHETGKTTLAAYGKQQDVAVTEDGSDRVILGVFDAAKISSKYADLKTITLLFYKRKGSF